MQAFREIVRPLVRDTVSYLHEVMTSPAEKIIIAEGANATMLDIDFGKSASVERGGECSFLSPLLYLFNVYLKVWLVMKIELE